MPRIAHASPRELFRWLMHNFHVTVVPSHLFDRYKNFERKFCEPRGKKKGEGKKASKKHFIPFHYRESKPTRQRFTVRGKRKGEVLSTTTHECCMTASQFYSIEIISISKILLVLRASPSPFNAIVGNATRFFLRRRRKKDFRG